MRSAWVVAFLLLTINTAFAGSARNQPISDSNDAVLLNIEDVVFNCWLYPILSKVGVMRDWSMLTDDEKKLIRKGDEKTYGDRTAKKMGEDFFKRLTSLPEYKALDSNDPHYNDKFAALAAKVVVAQVKEINPKAKIDWHVQRDIESQIKANLAKHDATCRADNQTLAKNFSDKTGEVIYGFAQLGGEALVVGGTAAAITFSPEVALAAIGGFALSEEGQGGNGQANGVVSK